MDLGIKGASAIISGGTQGIGLAIVQSLLSEGVKITAFSRKKVNIKSAEKKLTDYSEQIQFIQGDILSEKDRKNILKNHISNYKSLDFLINNAGQSIKTGTTEKKWSDSFESNITSHALLTDEAIKYLEKSKFGASIVNISSIFGRESGGSPHYNASKSAMISFSKSYSNLLIKKGIRVNSIAPGSIRFPNGSWDKRVKSDPSGMKKFIQQFIPAGRFGTVEEIANVVTFLISPKASWIVGATINVDGGQSRSNI